MAKDDKELIRDIDALDRRIEDLQNDEPSRWPDEDVEADKGKPENERIELGREAQTWEVLEALGVTRCEVGLALEEVLALLENLRDEVARLKQHRHDHSKLYTGRPEL